MNKWIVSALLIFLSSASTAVAQGNGNSAGGLPALEARVAALEAQLAALGSNDIADTEYVFTGLQVRFTDSIDGTFPFDNVLRISNSSAHYTFNADGTGTYVLTECQNAGIYSDFSADNSWMNSLSNLCGPLDVTMALTWEQDDNLVFISIYNHIADAYLEFDTVVSDDGSIMSSANVDGGVFETVYESHVLTGFTAVRVK